MIDTIIANHNKIDIFCIGTPKVTGDAIGPLVGSMLQQHDFFDKNVNIIGDLSSPVTYTTYNKFVGRLRDDAFVIVVDATVGKRVGTFDILLEPTRPGGALNTGIEPVGDLSIKVYTADSVSNLPKVDHWRVAKLAHVITTELKDLLSNNKKGIYIEI